MNVAWRSEWCSGRRKLEATVTEKGEGKWPGYTVLVIYRREGAGHHGSLLVKT